MLALFLLISTAIVFCAVAGVMLWQNLPGRKPESLRLFLRRISALRSASFSRRTNARVAAQGVRPFQIRWGDLKKPDVELSVTQVSRRQRLREVPMRAAAKEPISEFVLSVAQVFGAQSDVRALQMIFSPEIAWQLRNGKLDSMQGSIGRKPLAFDPGSGKIREIEGVAAAVNAFAAISIAWQVDGYLTASRFLAEINDSLRFVADHLGEIGRLFLDEHEAPMNANYRYLLQVSVSAEMGSLSPDEMAVVANQLKTIEQQTAQIFLHAQTELQRRIADLKETHAADLWTPNELVQATEFEISCFAQLAWLALLAQQTRAASALVRVALPLNKDGIATRVRELVHGWEACRRLQGDFFKKVDASADGIDEVCERQHVIDDSKAKVKARIKEVEAVLANASRQVGDALTRLQAAAVLDKRQEPIEILARIDGSEVTLAVDETAGASLAELAVKSGAVDHV